MITSCAESPQEILESSRLSPLFSLFLINNKYPHPSNTPSLYLVSVPTSELRCLSSFLIISCPNYCHVLLTGFWGPSLAHFPPVQFPSGSVLCLWPLPQLSVHGRQVRYFFYWMDSYMDECMYTHVCHMKGSIIKLLCNTRRILSMLINVLSGLRQIAVQSSK